MKSLVLYLCAMTVALSGCTAGNGSSHPHVDGYYDTIENLIYFMEPENVCSEIIAQLDSSGNIIPEYPHYWGARGYEVVNGDTLFLSVERGARCKDNELKDYIQAHVQTPPGLELDRIVTVKFQVRKDGTIGMTQVEPYPRKDGTSQDLSDLDPQLRVALEIEAVRVVKATPVKFAPAVVYDTYVGSWSYVPVIFRSNTHC